MEARWLDDIDSLHNTKIGIKPAKNNVIQGIGHGRWKKHDIFSSIFFFYNCWWVNKSKEGIKTSEKNTTITILTTNSNSTNFIRFKVNPKINMVINCIKRREILKGSSTIGKAKIYKLRKENLRSWNKLKRNSKIERRASKNSQERNFSFKTNISKSWTLKKEKLPRKSDKSRSKIPPIETFSYNGSIN